MAGRQVNRYERKQVNREKEGQETRESRVVGRQERERRVTEAGTERQAGRGRERRKTRTCPGRLTRAPRYLAVLAADQFSQLVLF